MAASQFVFVRVEARSPVDVLLPLNISLQLNYQSNWFQLPTTTARKRTA